MTIRPIVRMGHPILMGTASPVEDPTSDEIKSLISDMIETMEDVGGVGLAAPQVAVPLRLVIYKVPAERSSDGQTSVDLTVMINPEITPVGEEKDEFMEGCLSLPGMGGKVTRPTHIKCSYLNELGQKHEVEVSGFHARVIQHECDHLDGILYPMRMDDLASFGYLEDMQTELSYRKCAS